MPKSHSTTGPSGPFPLPNPGSDPQIPKNSQPEADKAPDDESFVMKLVQIVVVVIVIAAAMIFFNPSRITPTEFYPQPLPIVPVSYELDLAEPVFRAPRRLQGPESIAIHPTNGFLYSGTQDGRIMRARLSKPYNSSPETLGMIGDPNAALPLPCGTYTTEPVCGRPLGMEMVTPRGESDPILFFVDAYLGVAQYNAKNHQLQMLVGKEFTATDLKTGRKQKFSNVLFNDVAYDAVDNTLYFTVASTKFQLNDLLFDLLDLGQNGLLFTFDLSSGDVYIIHRDIAFANGIVIHPTKRTLFLSELGRARILSINIDSQNKSKYGTSTIFADNLPILPDNLAIVGDDEIWAAGVNLRVGGIATTTSTTTTTTTTTADPKEFPARIGYSMFDLLANYPKLRLLISKALPAPFAHYVVGKSTGGIVRMDLKSGTILNLMTTSHSHRNRDIQGIGLSLASITPHRVTDGTLPPDQIHIYTGGFTPETSSIGRFTWDLRSKSVVPSMNPTTNDEIREEYRRG